MSGTTGQQEGVRPRPSPRAASRSSTSSTKTRMTTLSSNGSFSQSPTSPQQGSTHPLHKFHHSTCSRLSERPRSRLSHEAHEESEPTLPPVSSFLQERIQSQRKMELERLSSRQSLVSTGASLFPRAAYSSPLRRLDTDSRRPQSSGGVESTRKGLGVKEMEQTLSTLHKQNFDLKLELYHRRERQTRLEERVEKLEAEQAKINESNDKLMGELEKRDHAVQEAVSVIIMLEARVDQLLRDRELVRRIENDEVFRSRNNTPTPLADVAALRDRESVFSDLQREVGARTLARQPSFLSDCSESTSNLRNVYIGVRGSVMSLPKMDGPDLDRVQTGSPSLSVLSESSFLSVYGQKDVKADTRMSELDGAPFDYITDSEPSGQTPPRTRRQPKVLTPSNMALRAEPRSTDTGSARYQAIGRALRGDSPLQRLENLEKTWTALDDTSRSASHEQLFGRRPSTSRSLTVKTASLPKTKQEKRDALQKVMTSGQSGRDFASSNGLPPTPDTISTGTLNRFKNSNDTLADEQGRARGRSYTGTSDGATSQGSLPENKDGSGEPGNGVAQPVSTTAFDGLKEFQSDGSYQDNGFGSGQAKRPQSGHGSTISNPRGSVRLVESNIDDSDDDMDYWIQESKKADLIDGLTPLSSASQAGNPNKGRVSPDLFSFPTTTSGWATNAMFGSLGGNGYNGAAEVMAPTISPLANTLDALGDSLPRPLFGSGLASPVLGGGFLPPPPPDRRSSLQARTGSSHSKSSGFGSVSRKSSPAQARPRKTPEKRRERSNSVDAPPLSFHHGVRAAAAHMGRSPTAPPQHPMPVADTPLQQQMHKQRRYPPTASQPARSRGFGNIFRRSTGSSALDVQPPASAPASQTSFRDAEELPATVASTQVGVPSWGRQQSEVSSYDDDDRDSATPPPIMRNRRESFDGGAPLDGGAPVGVIPGPSTPSKQGPSATNGGTPVKEEKKEGGGRRKWLGLGRVSSLRTRAG